MPKAGMFSEWVQPGAFGYTTLTPSFRDFVITANGTKYRWSTGSSGQDLPKVSWNILDAWLANRRRTPSARDEQPQEESNRGNAQRAPCL